MAIEVTCDRMSGATGVLDGAAAVTVDEKTGDRDVVVAGEPAERGASVPSRAAVTPTVTPATTSAPTTATPISQRVLDFTDCPNLRAVETSVGSEVTGSVQHCSTSRLDYA
ncbi:hypothetical protein [Amycolatopsis methanolica]|uniref:hypothetical protein n=1 Tax=Amycolatopsis methanolica TaxID=1814 RepID=UPI0034267503